MSWWDAGDEDDEPEYDESDVRVRPNRKGSRPRTKQRPEHADAIMGSVLGVDHTDKGQSRKVVALGDELRADDDVDLAVLDLAQGLAQVADAWGEIARQKHAPRLGEECSDFFVDAFDTGAARHERMLRPAIGTSFGDGNEGAAMVTF